MKKLVDVFIILTDTQVRQGSADVIQSLQEYRSALNLPNAK
jgi:hypothetical protein